MRFTEQELKGVAFVVLSTAFLLFVGLMCLAGMSR